MSKFKVGDEVKIGQIITTKGIYSAPKDTIGKTGVITDIDEDHILKYLVCFNDDEDYFWYQKKELVSPKTRGFEIVSTFVDQNVTLPTRKTQHSAGYDFSILKGSTIEPHQTVKFDTGVKAYMLPDEFLGIHIRSSLGIKRNLILSNCTGIIDCDYHNNPDNEGHIIIALTNTSDTPQVVADGECVAQGIFYKYLTVDNDQPGGKRIGGIGSSGTR